MIKTWKHKGLKLFFETGSKKGINAQYADRIRRMLDTLNAATVIEDMDLPGFKLHELTGDRRGTWAVTVSGNRRITFQFIHGDAHDTNPEDYH